MLTSRERCRNKLQPFPDIEEARYIKVKRSMCAIKHVLHERKRIAAQIEADKAAVAPTSTESSTQKSSTDTK